MKKNKHNSTVIVGDYNASLLVMDIKANRMTRNVTFEQHYKLTRPNGHL